MAAVRCREDKLRNVVLFQMRGQALFQNIQKAPNPLCYNFMVVSCNFYLAAKDRELSLEILVLKVCYNFLKHIFFIRVRSSVLDLQVFKNRLSNPA